MKYLEFLKNDELVKWSGEVKLTFKKYSSSQYIVIVAMPGRLVYGNDVTWNEWHNASVVLPDIDAYAIYENF